MMLPLEALVFEHAVKHQMVNVLQVMKGKRTNRKQLMTSLRNPFLTMLHLFIFKTSLLKDFKMMHQWDPDIVKTFVLVLDRLYSVHKFVPERVFFPFFSRLKLLEIIIRIKRAEETQSVFNKLDVYFPDPSGFVWDKLEARSGTEWVKWQKDNNKRSRQYAIPLIMKKHMFKEDASDVKKFVAILSNSLDDVSEGLFKYLPESELEKIVSRKNKKSGIARRSEDYDCLSITEGDLLQLLEIPITEGDLLRLLEAEESLKTRVDLNSF